MWNKFVSLLVLGLVLWIGWLWYNSAPEQKNIKANPCDKELPAGIIYDGTNLKEVVDNRMLIEARISACERFKRSGNKVKKPLKFDVTDEGIKKFEQKKLKEKKEDARRRARKRIAEAKALEDLRKKIKNCMFENVEKVTNKITERIVYEECRERAINGSDWSSKLIDIIRELKKGYKDF